MNTAKHYLLWPLLAAGLIAQGQTRKLDSLRSTLHQTTDKQERLQLLLALGNEQHSLNRDTAYQYAAEATALAAKGNRRDKALAALYFAQSYVPWGWVDSALAVLEPVLPSNPVTDPESRDLYFLLCRQRALLYGMRTQYKEALEILYQLIDQAEKYKDSVTLASNLNSIGSVAIAREQPKTALPWLYKALAATDMDRRYDPVKTAIYTNFGNAFVLLNRNDSALFYLQKAIPVAERIENFSLLNTALRVQTSVLVKTKQLQEAEQSFRKMQEVRAKTEVANIVDDNLATADFYIETGQLEKAISYCKENLQYRSRDEQTPKNANYISSVSMRLAFYEALAKCYKLLGRNEEYRQTLEQIIPLKDSSYKAGTEKEIADIETRYETQLRENAIIQRQQEDITRKNYLFYGFLCLLFIAVWIGIWRFREYRRKQNVIAREAVKNAEEKERVRIAADLHDNLGAYAASMASNLNYLHVDEKDGLVKNAFREIQANSGAMIAELNDTIWALKKESLSLTAISDRFKVFISRLRKSYPGISIEVEENIEHDHILSSSQAFHLYRILQEAVNNSLKHSQGTRVQVFITGNSSWKVAVVDNGRGMPETGEIKESNGLNNMRVRSGEHGWAIRWLNGEEGGTIVEIQPTKNR